MDSPIQERPSGASLHDQLSDRGWVYVPGLVAAEEAHEVDGALRRALGASTEPLLRVHSSEPEPHRRDAYGRIVNPVIHPGRLPGPQFAEVHGVEQRLVLGTPLLALATSLLGGPVQLLQSAWWESSRGSPWHRDHNPLVPGAPMLGVWLALERIERAAGAFVVFDRSHRVQADEPLADALRRSEAQYQDHYVARRPNAAEAVRTTHEAIASGLARAGCAPVIFTIGAGDVVAWRSDVVHGSETPAPGPATRSSLLLHFVGR